VAIALVLGAHAALPGMGGGAVGVDLFFVLSGFLISRNLMADFARNGRVDFVTFYFHRFMRIVPPLAFVCLALALASPFAGIPLAVLSADLSVALSFVSNYTRADFGIPIYLAHTWSLSVEEQFYLLWPVVFLVLMSSVGSTRRIVACLLALAVAVALWRWHRFAMSIDPIGVYDGFDTRFDALAYGCALAFLSDAERHTLARFWPAALGVFAALVSAGAWDQPWMFAGGYSLVAISAAILVAATERRANGIFSGVVESQPLRLLGRISYALYLWHFPPLLMLHATVGGSPSVLVWSIPIGIAGATASYLLVERPMAGLKTLGDLRVRSALSMTLPILLAIGVLYVLPRHGRPEISAAPPGSQGTAVAASVAGR
jgi:peptidoglycan/LPS O-acetylase OafA/YrhL